MRTLIRIVFVIFIANEIDCLGRVCDDCCDCFKEKDENITADSLVNNIWYKHKKGLVLKIFEKNNDIFTSTDNKYKISIKSDEEGNHKIAYQNESKQELKLEGKKYALFEIKTQEEENTVYLYCSDVESSKNKDGVSGIFQDMDHISISVIACDTEKVTNMRYMFCNCNSLTKLDLQKFNTTNVTDMEGMFYKCSSLIELNLQNFNTTNVTNMEYMFCNCYSLTELNIKNFNTTNVTNMEGMFYWCSNLKELYLQNFNTKNVTNMEKMFYYCEKLAELKLEEIFNTKNVTHMMYMFFGCISFPKNIQNDLNNVERIINFFKGKNK